MKEASAEVLQRTRIAVDPFAQRLDLAARLEPFRHLRWDGSDRGRPVLHLDDFAGIPFLDGISGVLEYQHRARLRALGGDSYAAVTEPTPGYEEYCRARLRLESVGFVHAGSAGGGAGLAQACCQGEAWESMVSMARRAGGLDLHPFMGIEPVWELARRIAAEAGVPVGVIGPPPPVTWIANDKGSFSELVEILLGPQWLVESASAADAASLARKLRELAAHHPRVALKRLRCASAMGNEVYESRRLLAEGLPQTEQQVTSFLERTEWQGDEEVLAVAWEEADTSPSTQLWIPPREVGPPRLDGIYEQLLAGERKVFIGSRPSTLPARVDSALAAASLEVAAGLQALGYVGRCSFDLLVVGDPAGEFEIRFTECNGRWGGTSTPMSFLDRLLGAPRPSYRAQDVVDPGLVGTSFRQVLEVVGEEAYDVRTGGGSYIFYNTGPLAEFGKLDVIALGSSQEAADAALEEDLPRLLGL
jgi:hypothetical protein